MPPPKSARDAPKRAEARIRELCDLNLAGPLIAPAVFKALHKLIPHERGFLMWIDSSGSRPVVVDAFSTLANLVQWMACDETSLFECSINGNWPAIANEGPSAPRPTHIVQCIAIAEIDNLPASELFQVFKVSRFLRLTIRDAKQRSIVMLLARSKDDDAFSRSEIDTLERLSSPLVALMDRNHPKEFKELCLAESANVVVWPRAQLSKGLNRAPELLACLNGSGVIRIDKLFDCLPDGVKRAVQALYGRVADGREPVLPPWRVCNAWGRFTAEFDWMHGRGKIPHLITINLKREVPRSIRFLENIFDLELPIKQENVCRMLASDMDESEIARKMSISRETVKYHRKEIYGRWNGRSRFELFDALLAQPKPPENTWCYFDPQQVVRIRANISRLKLSPIQEEICFLLVDTWSFKVDIAEALEIPQAEVTRHRDEIYRRLGVHTRTMLMDVLSK